MMYLTECHLIADDVDLIADGLCECVVELSKCSEFHIWLPSFHWIVFWPIWIHMDSLGFTWTHLDSFGLTWTHLVSLGLNWIHLDSVALTWIHLGSLAFTWTH